MTTHTIKTHTLESLRARCVEEGDCLIWQGYSANNTPQVYMAGPTSNAGHNGRPVSVRWLMALLDGDAEAFAEFDYQLYHQLAFASGNPIYALILNGFQGLYNRVGRVYFAEKLARDGALKFYQQLRELAAAGKSDDVWMLVRHYGAESGKIWAQLKCSMSANLDEV